MAINYDLSSVKGDTVRIETFLTGVTGATLDLSGCTLTASLRKGYYPSSLVVLYQKYVPAGSTLTTVYGFTGGLGASATGGTAQIIFGSTYMNQISSNTTAKYDLEVYDPILKDIKTLVRGSIEILPDVTNM